MTGQEPTYHYVKGRGWVPSVHETHSFESGGYRVTLIMRNPEIGEHHFHTSISPESIENDLKTLWWQKVFKEGKYGQYIPTWTEMQSARDYHKLYTVFVEKV